MRRKACLAFLAGLWCFTAVGSAQILIVGTNTYPADVDAIQAAVRIPYSTVDLTGIFNFGDTGQVVFSAPGVTLQGDEAGATIKGGYFPLTTIAVPDGVAPDGVKNVTISNIRFEGWRGYAINHAGVKDEDNTTRIEGNTFINTRWPEFDDSYGINYCSGGGKAIIRRNKLVRISLFSISTYDLTLHKDDYLIIEGNIIEDALLDPLVIEAHNPLDGDVDGGPAIIRNNRIEFIADNPNPIAWGISLGTFYFGYALNNAVVEGNVLKGRACDGIISAMYGRGRRIINNDLSGLTVAEAQIISFGQKDFISGNKLGPVDTTGELGNPISTGIILMAQDWSFWYPPGLGPNPEPVTKNVLLANDFRRTGLKGWVLDAVGNFNSMGCVLLISPVDMGWSDWWPGCEVTGNIIMEVGRFPRGTGGPKRQVLEVPVYAHDNAILGHTAGPNAQFNAVNAGSFRADGGDGMNALKRFAEKLDFIKKIRNKMADYKIIKH